MGAAKKKSSAVKKSAKTSAADTSKKSVKKAVKKAENKVAKKVVKKIAKKVVKKSATQAEPATAKAATKKVAKKAVKKVVKKAAAKSAAAKSAAAKSAAQSTPKSTTKSIPKSKIPSPPKKQSVTDDDYLVLMQKDPNWLHAFWNVSERRRRMALKEGEKMVLRLYDVSRDQTVRRQKNPVQQIEIPADASNWYIRREDPSSRYHAEVGTTGEDGSWNALAGSNTAEGNASFEHAWQEWQEGMDLFIRESLGGGEITTFGSSALGLRRYLLESGKMPEWPGSFGVSSESFSSPGSASWMQNMAEAAGLPKDFFLWVKTRLIVYGGTRPDAHLKVRGEPFPLTPEGTFWLEMDLPDSTQVIPVHATDKDGDFGRTITPIVEKRTE